MTSSKKDYDKSIRETLPNYITYDEKRAKYVTTNGKYFNTYKEAEWYWAYIQKHSRSVE